MKSELLVLIRKNFLVLALVIFTSLFFTDAIFFNSVKQVQSPDKICLSNEGLEKTKDVPRLSEIRKPQIDDRAASISCKQSAIASNVSACRTLPTTIWIFLLIAYLALLVFNLTYEFKKNNHLRWGWEVVLSGIFIFGWFYFDQCFVALWFPLYVIKLGAMTYVVYLYFFEKIKYRK